MNLSKVDGHIHLVRDQKTKAILNTNMNEYQNYKEQKRLKEKETQKIEYLENDINIMKNDLNEIKNLLRSIINESK